MVPGLHPFLPSHSRRTLFYPGPPNILLPGKAENTKHLHLPHGAGISGQPRGKPWALWVPPCQVPHPQYQHPLP